MEDLGPHIEWPLCGGYNQFHPSFPADTYLAPGPALCVQRRGTGEAVEQREEAGCIEDGTWQARLPSQRPDCFLSVTF